MLTVLHACRTVNNLIDTDKQFKSYVIDIEKELLFNIITNMFNVYNY